jgi:prepilin-type N-terminal cleavage/methylation domain-containing protein
MIDISTDNRKHEGFTLLEVLICMGLIVIALLAVFRLQAVNMGHQAEADFVSLATQLARDRLSRLRGEIELAQGKRSGDFGETYPDFVYEEEIAGSEALTGLYRVTIRVLRQDGGAGREWVAHTHLFRSEGE